MDFDMENPAFWIISVIIGIIVLVIAFMIVPIIGSSFETVSDTITSDHFSIIFSGNISEGDTFTCNYAGGTAETYEFSYNNTITAGNIGIT